MTTIKPPLRRRQNNNRQTYTYVVLLILVVLFLGTIGVQFVVKTSLYFAGFNKTETNKVEESGVLIEPEINGLPDATNSAKIFVEGRASEKSLLELYVNEEKTDEIQVPDGTFALDVQLTPGENSLYVRSFDEKKANTKDSQVYKIIFINTLPELTINNPTDGAELDKEDVTVSGRVSENTTIKINGLPTIINQGGEFSRVVQLVEGENTINIQVRDLAGNTVEKQIKVQYRK